MEDNNKGKYYKQIVLKIPDEWDALCRWINKNIYCLYTAEEFWAM